MLWQIFTCSWLTGLHGKKQAGGRPLSSSGEETAENDDELPEYKFIVLIG